MGGDALIVWVARVLALVGALLPLSASTAWALRVGQYGSAASWSSWGIVAGLSLMATAGLAGWAGALAGGG